ncbi:MAG: GtrA family protein [Treponema sp.]|jgi:putative flippase GtrA|nr:GtrA family protein [Treponema sp.]
MTSAALILRKYIPFLRQVVLYGVFGCLSAFVDILIFSLLSGFLNVNLANFISVHCGILCSFLLNTFFTFKVKDKIKRRIAIFFCVGYLGLLLSMLILWVGVDKIGFDKMPVKIVSVFIVAAVQFLLNKFITYRDSGKL